MTVIDDAFVQKMLGQTKPYCVAILRATDTFAEPGAQAVVWEHGRRDFQLRADGVLHDDPCVRAGLFTYDLYQSLSFPEDSL
ncbi:MAG: hypothetical protein ACM3SQ_01800 [Betaproteobacteria bacterium]